MQNADSPIAQEVTCKYKMQLYIEFMEYSERKFRNAFKRDIFKCVRKEKDIHAVSIQASQLEKEKHSMSKSKHS